MTIHKEGYRTILIVGWGVVALIFLSLRYLYPVLPIAHSVLSVVLVAVWVFIISFFRIPKRTFTYNEQAFVSPADGKVVVIEETVDAEYYHEKRLQISVFMSPANVHVNRYPISGEVIYNQYHKGKYLVAWDPKSSTENERHSLVIQTPRNSVLVKQIAGALAKRIINYAAVGKSVKQNDELGFIKFGSRVDLLLPLDAKPAVKIGDQVKNGITVLATFS